MIVRHYCIFVLLLITSVDLAFASRNILVVNGTIKFSVATNVLALTVEGQSRKMTANVMLDSSGATLNMETIDAAADAKTFTTGMALRDDHMRNRIFALSDGTIPSVQFSSRKTTCPKPQPRQEASCSVAGQLTLRGATRPFTIDLKIRDEGGGYRIDGSSGLTLSAFGIEPPCQLGVCVKDNVKLTFAFQAKDAAGR